MVLQTVNKEPTVFSTHDELVAMVKNREINGALILDVSGETQIAQALADENLTVRSVPKELIKNLPPYFSSVRIPSGTYPGHPQSG